MRTFLIASAALLFTIFGQNCSEPFKTKAEPTKDQASQSDSSFSLMSVPTSAGDFLTWMHSQLDADQYVEVHAEGRASENSAWFARAAVTQPFKSQVNMDTKSVFWRKDVWENYAGEIFNFDEDRIYLRSETFPRFPDIEPDSVWDLRPDKVRMFGNSRMGTPVARRAVVGSDFSATFNTYRCTSAAAIGAETCPLYQNGVRYDLSFQGYVNWSTVFDGEMPAYPASPEMKNFDQAIAMVVTINGTAARERFFFARKGQKYYGIVRWDNALYVNGQWVVTERSMGVSIKRDSRISFAGMVSRLLSDVDTRPTAQPMALTADEVFVQGLYRSVLGRSGSTQEVSYYTQSIAAARLSRKDVLRLFVESPEFRARATSFNDRDYVIQLYAIVLGRTAAVSEVDYHVANLQNARARRDEVAQQFLSSGEFLSRQL